jgi:hypothetical protein
LTTNFNTHQNSVVVRENWCLNHPKGILGLKEFREHVSLAVYGDDNQMNISDYAIKFFNQQTIAAMMPKLGHVYTEETKSGRQFVSRDIKEVTLLKRAFRYDEEAGLYLAPLALEVVLDIPYWVHNKDCMYEITKTNVDLVLQELSLHSRPVYEKWAPLIEAAARERLGYVPGTVSYELNQKLARSSDLIW